MLRVLRNSNNFTVFGSDQRSVAFKTSTLTDVVYVVYVILVQVYLLTLIIVLIDWLIDWLIVYQENILYEYIPSKMITCYYAEHILKLRIIVNSDT